MYLSSPDAMSIIRAIHSRKISSESLVLILLAERSRKEIPGLIRELKKNGIKFCGGVFPGVIYGDKLYDEGGIIIDLPTREPPFLIKNLDTDQFVLPDFGPQITRPQRKKYTAIILVDGWASFISLFLSEIFNQLGNSLRYFGGGAGSLNLRGEPCIFTQDGEYRNAALIIFTSLESTLGVRHGWKRLAGPIMATGIHDHAISELNWEPALEIYRDNVEPYYGKKISAKDFPRVSMEYPFGIYKKGGEDVVRDPIAVSKKGELICVGEVPENTALYIMSGDEDSLLSGARHAAQDCMKQKSKENRFCLVADGVSRSVFLGKAFHKELKIIKNILSPSLPQGILSIGEIASHSEAYLYFYNKTIVVGLFHG